MNELAAKVYADLVVQAMMFDMDVDVEIMELTMKNEHVESVWLRRWKDKMKSGDYNEIMDGDWYENERHIR